MRIGLIAVSGVRVKTKELAELGVTLPGFVRRGKVIASLPSLGLLTVAGLTPAKHELHYIEVDQSEDLAGIPEFDLVGISSFTARIEFAYELAAQFRAKGTKVVLGGLHVSMNPIEAQEHADAILIGGAEGTWPQLLEDAEKGCLRRIYLGRFDQVFEPSNYAMPRFEFLQGRSYNRVTVQTSRGCPRSCEFCAASLRITRKFNQKPVDLVMKEIQEARKYFAHPFFEFADDNTFINREWSKTFLKRLAREEIHYFTETDVSVAEDPILCDAIASSGCNQLLIGFESPSASDLTGMDPKNWKQEQAPRYRKVIDMLQTRGVSVNGCFILGLDSHTPDIFPQLLDFVKGSGLAEVQYTVLTPFPGTPLYQRLKSEGRLLSESFWDRCTLFDVNYRPKQMSVQQLESGLRWLFQETYSQDATRERIRGFVRQRSKERKEERQKFSPLVYPSKAK